jgi:hypothetical protein
MSNVVDSLRHLLVRSQPPAAWSRMHTAAEGYLMRARAAVAPYWQRGAEWYEKREPREKILLRVLGAVGAIMFGYNAIYLPARTLRNSLADRVVTRQQQLSHLRSMMRSYERLQTELAATQKRTVTSGKDPALFSVLEMTLTNSVGRSKIGSITPAEHQLAGGFQQYSVDVKLSEIALPQIVDTLYELQTLKVPITISNFQIHQHAANAHSYDVDLTCVALAKTS